MYKSKKDDNKHVEEQLSKLSVKEMNDQSYSIARLYFDVGDYVSCQYFVEQYLTQEDDNAAAYRLHGQALQMMGQKDKALEQFKMSLEIDGTHTGTILDICELLNDEDVSINSGQAKYWFVKCESIFPKNPITLRLRERLMKLAVPEPESRLEALIDLLASELKLRPEDPLLHATLLKHYLEMNKFAEAFEYSCKIEFSSLNFTNDNTWYEILDVLLKHNLEKTDKCLCQLLLLTVKERLTLLSLTETPIGTSKSLVESAELLHAYDQALASVAKAGAAPDFAEFHAGLLHHHRAQFFFHAATLLLKRAKKENSRWYDSTKAATPLMLLAWQAVPLDSEVNWLKNAPDKLQNAVRRWYSEGCYRCSQSGHYLLKNFQDKNQLLDQISQCCSGFHWKEKMYEKIFTATHESKIKTSHFKSNAFTAPQLSLPRKSEVEAYDSDAQKNYGNSLHHFVWTLLNYENFARFKCTPFDMLTLTVTSSGPETLNKLDVYAFLYCAALTTRQQKSNEELFMSEEKPKVLPANITDLLCTHSQMKWWDCAYKFCHNILGTELADIQATLSRGIEVVRCIDNYSLDPELLCILGRIFRECANDTRWVDEKNHLNTRAGLYYGCAIPLLEKLESKIMIKVSDKRFFDYTHEDIGTEEVNVLLEESKLFVAVIHINEKEYKKAIELLVNVKSQHSYYHLAQALLKLVVEESHSYTEGSKSKYALLSKAKNYAEKALHFKDHEINRNLALSFDTIELIDDIEINMSKMEDSKNTIDNDQVDQVKDQIQIAVLNKEVDTLNNSPSEQTLNESKVYNLDETQLLFTPQMSLAENYPFKDLTSIEQSPAEVKVTTEEEEIAIFSSRAKLFRFVDRRTKRYVYRNVSSTLKAKHNNTNYQTADSQILETNMDENHLERIGNEMKNLQKRDQKITDLLEQTKSWFEENRNLGNKIIITSNTNRQDITDQLKQLKVSVDQVKDQIEECRNECKDVEKQITELKKEVDKFQKAPIQLTLNDNVKLRETTEDSNKSKLNSSDTVEDFEPDVEFNKPVIALPVLAEQVTGEEDKTSSSEHRAFDSKAKEWKECELDNEIARTQTQ